VKRKRKRKKMGRRGKIYLYGWERSRGTAEGLGKGIACREFRYHFVVDGHSLRAVMRGVVIFFWIAKIMC
jgi:hypothetical protein